MKKNRIFATENQQTNYGTHKTVRVPSRNALT